LQQERKTDKKQMFFFILFNILTNYVIAAYTDVRKHKGGTKMAVKGGCLCGKIRYQVSGALFNVDHCHCSMCRRQHGAAFSTYAEFNPGEFVWTLGEELVRIYEILSGGGWCFCSECGSTLAGTVKGKITSITLGTVEGDPGIKPESHIFVGSKAQWHDIYDDLPQFEERPPDT
jgi:hypothetical protein